MNVSYNSFKKFLCIPPVLNTAQKLGLQQCIQQTEISALMKFAF